jgi:hypothetical protein
LYLNLRTNNRIVIHIRLSIVTITHANTFSYFLDRDEHHVCLQCGHVEPKQAVCAIIEQPHLNVTGGVSSFWRHITHAYDERFRTSIMLYELRVSIVRKIQFS